jgi:nucleoside-diphosphate-sugar epimerase
MSTLLTGAFGRVGTALIDNAADNHEFTYLDTIEHPELPTEVVDVADYPAFEAAAAGNNAIVHLAAASMVDSSWQAVLQSNIIGAYNCFEAARQSGIEKVVFASTNHVVGMYEEERAPDLYEPKHDLLLDGDESVRPDSYYATSKVFGEALGRYYVENHAHPKRVYALRLGSVRWPDEDHPYADADRGVRTGEWSQNSEAYDREVRRLKATWLSRRDATALVEACLSDGDVSFDVFYGTSDNERGWLDIDPARERLGYNPVDSGEDWSAPPVEASVPQDSSAFALRNDSRE